jgi:hypothetical protein
VTGRSAETLHEIEHLRAGRATKYDVVPKSWAVLPGPVVHPVMRPHGAAEARAARSHGLSEYVARMGSGWPGLSQPEWSMSGVNRSTSAM